MIGALLTFERLASEGSAGKAHCSYVTILTIFMPEIRYEEFVLDLLLGLEVFSMFIFLI